MQSVYVPFTHKSFDSDGSVVVYGKVTGEQLDSAHQIVDSNWARKALKVWFDKAANIRVMHNASLPPVGKGEKIEEKKDGYWLTSRIVDTHAIKLLKEGIYKGYSIGIYDPHISYDPNAKRGRIDDGYIIEVSLVDYPALDSARIESVEDYVPKFLVAQLESGKVVYKGKVVNMDENEESKALEPDEEKSEDEKLEKSNKVSKSKESEGEEPEDEESEDEEQEDEEEASEEESEPVKKRVSKSRKITKASDEHEDRDEEEYTRQEEDAPKPKEPRAEKRATTTRTKVLYKCASCGCDCVEGNPDPDCTCKCNVCSGKTVEKGVRSRVQKAEFDTEEREKLAKEGKALPDGCLSAETLVITPLGEMPISTLLGTSTLLMSNGTWKSVSVESFGIQHLYAVTLQRGIEQRVIYATRGHRWYLTSGDIKTTNKLTNGDRVPSVAPNIPAKFESSKETSLYAFSKQSSHTWANTSGMYEMWDESSSGGILPENGEFTQAKRLQVLCSTKSEILGYNQYPTEKENFKKGGTSQKVWDYTRGLRVDATEPVRCLLPLSQETNNNKSGSGPRSSNGKNTGTSLWPMQHKVGMVGRDGRCAEDVGLSPWIVSNILDTNRTEEVFCAIVPDTHSFVLGGGILTGNSFPIRNVSDLKNAVHDYGRASDSKKAAVKRHIIRRAEELNAMSEVPQEWHADKAFKSLLKASNVLSKMFASKRAFYSEEVRQNAKRAFDSFIEDMKKLDPIFDSVELDVEPPMDEPYPGEAHPDGAPSSEKGLRQELDELKSMISKMSPVPTQVTLPTPVARAGVRVQEPTPMQPEIKKAAANPTDEIYKSWAEYAPTPEMRTFATIESAKLSMQKGAH